DGEDEITKGLFTNFTKRLRDDEGVKFTTVLHNYTKADYEGIISLKNTKELIYWLGGALAGAEINESITNKKYDGEYEFDAKFSNSELKDTVKNGELVFYYDSGEKKVLKDINTFTSFSTDKNSDFSNNQIIRVLDATANDIARIFNDYYLGKMQNDELGRDMFKAEVINYFRQLQSIRAIDNFNDNDIEVSKGTEKGDVVLDVLVEPIACMDKLYMKCIIE
ncbi:MAG: phage tail sheath subtilisin-like domain-containing protein, partial [Eubacteriales bacterium]|nr:phage tail sheath subtilisin-like domain-containing protein [Eubacteriales bacterium]